MIKYSYVACLKAAVISFVFYLFFIVYWREAYSETCQTSKVELFAKIDNK